MLEGVETGYEEQWDFPDPASPAKPYLLATVPRTGSTYVSHLLWRSGRLGAPLEYLNFEPSGPYGHASASPELQRGLWENALRKRTSPNGVFGLKAFPLQLEELSQSNPPLLAGVLRFLLPPGRARVVRLRRRDVTAHAISYARAMLSGIWRAEQEAGERVEPEYDAQALERANRLIAAQERAWEDMCRDMRIGPLTVWYEDAVADPAGTVAEVAGYLGAELDPAVEIAVPQVRRQEQRGARAWKEQAEKGG